MLHRLKAISLSGLLAMSLAACQGDLGVEGGEAMTTDPTPKRPDPVDPKIPTMEDCVDNDEIFAGQADMRLMTRYEFDNTVRDLLGIDANLASETFPPENAPNGFENNSDSHAVNPLTIRNMMEVAETLSERALTEQRNRLLSCDAADAGCGSTFVESFVTQAFRRPPTNDELAIYQGLFDSTEADFGFDQAVQLTVQAALQSPQFLYRIEFTDMNAPGDLVQIQPYEMANRLSYFLWATMPDEALFQAAEAGELTTREEIRAQAARMIQDPRSKTTIEHFYRQWLHLDALNTMVKDSEAYPEWTPEVTDAWRESLYAFVRSVHEGGGTVDDLFTTNSLPLDSTLGPIYGHPDADGMQPVSMDANQRAGILTHPALLAMLSYPNQGSPIARGVFVRERILCQKLPSPPDDIQIEPPDPDANATTREVFALHSSAAGCSECHKLIDPIGLGFENYDGIGRYRTTENGFDVDGTGHLGSTRDASIAADFDGAVQLSGMLAEADEVQKCVADQWFTFAMGRPETRADMCGVDAIQKEFVASGGQFEDLLIAVVTSDTFRYRTVQVEPGDAQ